MTSRSLLHLNKFFAWFKKKFFWFKNITRNNFIKISNLKWTNYIFELQNECQKNIPKRRKANNFFRKIRCLSILILLIDLIMVDIIFIERY